MLSSLAPALTLPQPDPRGRPHARPTGNRDQMPRTTRMGTGRRWGVSALSAALLSLAACSSGPTEDILRGGVPARTDLHRATQLPPQSVRGVARRDFGWRLMYHPAHAPAGAEARAAVALCRLERRGVARITPVPRIDPSADPGLRILDVHCI